jgi:cell division inhibitor SulA
MCYIIAPHHAIAYCQENPMMTRPMPSVAFSPPHRVPSLTLAPVLSTGRASLDQRLPGGGWPLGGLVELFADDETALAVLLPLLRVLSVDAERWVTLVHPPMGLLGTVERHRELALVNLLGVHEHPRLDPASLTERVLAGGTSAAVLVWSRPLAPAALAALRFQQHGRDTPVFVVSPPDTLPSAAPSGALRLHAVTLPPDGLSVQVLHTPRSAEPGAVAAAATASAPPLALNG